jgi:nitrile hydratase accessory protein
VAPERPAPRLELEGTAAPPRRNGELVFEEVWEGRLFGLTMALFEAGAFAWDEFRTRLMAEIARWEREEGARGGAWSYWARWLAAFEALVADKGLCPSADVEARAAALAARPHGHDHG